MRAQSHLLSAMKGSQAPETALRSAAGQAVAPSQLPRPAVEPAEDAPIPCGPEKAPFLPRPWGTSLPAQQTTSAWSQGATGTVWRLLSKYTHMSLLSSCVCQAACPGAVSRTFNQGGGPGVPGRKQALVRSAVDRLSWVQLDRGGWEDLKAEGLVAGR